MNIWKISEKYILTLIYKYFIFTTLNNIVNNIKIIYNILIMHSNDRDNSNETVDYLNYDANEFITTHSKSITVNTKKEMFNFKIKELQF